LSNDDRAQNEKEKNHFFLLLDYVANPICEKNHRLSVCLEHMLMHSNIQMKAT